MEQYAVLRLIAGVGLAGELGAGITLVSEVMSKESRGYGTMLVATIGILGAVAAALVGDFFEWRIAFFVGGGLGMALLILRIGVYESGMFSMILKGNVKRGLFQELFTSWDRFIKYIKCIAIGIPIWFIVGVLITFSPEFAKQLGVKEAISAGSAVMYCYIGLALGDFTSGSLSQLIRSRKKVVLIYLLIMTLFIGVYLFYNHFTSFYFYTLCILLGFGGGYWAIFVTIASEQFGTNLRATVTTTVPNFVRGGVVPMTLAFEFVSGHIGIVYGGLTISLIALLIAYISAINLEETYGKDLNYVEIL
jgi:MFS family permease